MLVASAEHSVMGEACLGRHRGDVGAERRLRVGSEGRLTSQ
jgi:hypothetical protein